ncbi:unnamed protein product (macronuclear) [Paramecium tetraurelia]|uniref:phosphoglycerate kinase n=1 Tax=Paramecium tetraurelia TaxID=5888 RepID=A0D4I0_PARTE|nr:uncharacterized protein GSPATT00013413001 [Paramecium tetraurelia]CAK77947.1 unnamed protein product [Paramecium tetraurelia]|eukprot:XP_001445344.1 hypothetical protein (macronuclear) [Paramecium tetraurelia strain d4-2]
MDDSFNQTQPKKKTFYIRRRADDSQKQSKLFPSVQGPISQYPSIPISKIMLKKPTSGVPSQISRGQDKQDPRVSTPKGPVSRISELDEEEKKNEVEGPQLKMKKEHISFLVKTENSRLQIMQLFQIMEVRLFIMSGSELRGGKEERFFCHHDQNVIKPGERIKFVFSFLSKQAGVFNEEWELKCEPPCLTQLPNLKLTGIAFIDDELTNGRKEFQKQVKNKFALKIATEIVDDIFEEVKTPPPPKPDLSDPEQFKIEFEELNLGEQLWFTHEIMNFFNFSSDEICQVLKQDIPWNGDVKLLRQSCHTIDEEEVKDLVLRKLELWVKLAKKVPISRNPIYSVVKDLLGDVANQVPQLSEDMRKELQMWEYTFHEPEDLTPEKAKAKLDEFNKNESKLVEECPKKKKWNDDMEKELIEEYKTKLGAKVADALAQAAIKLENDGQLLQVGAMMKPELKWNVFRRRRYQSTYFYDLLRKKTIQDSDIEGKKIGLKIHLKLANRPDVYELKEKFEQTLLKEQEEENKRLEEERLEKERLAQEAAKKKGKGKPVKQKEVEVVQVQQKNYDLSHLDQATLQECVDTIKLLMERQAKIVYKFTSSTKFFYEWLKTHVECPVYFNDAIIENLDEQLETQTYQENSVLVLENLFFYPDEVGYPEEEPDIESKTPYRTLLPYGNIYIIGDRVNFFSRFYPSIIHMNADQTILSSAIAKDIHILCHNLMGCQDRNGTLILGGDLTGDKLLTIDQLSGHLSSIVLLGKLGLAFYLTMYEIPSDLVSEAVRDVIKNLLNVLRDESTEKPPQRLTRIQSSPRTTKTKGKIIQLQHFLKGMILPIKSMYRLLLQALHLLFLKAIYNLKREKYFQIMDLRLLKLLNKKSKMPKDCFGQMMLTLDYTTSKTIALLKKLREEEAERERERLEKLKEKKGGKGNKKGLKEEPPKEPINIKTTKEINVPVFNLTNTDLGFFIYEMNQEKKDRHQHAQKQGHQVPYDFNQDCVVTIIGENLEKVLNQEDFQNIGNEEEIEQAPEPSQKGSQFPQSEAGEDQKEQEEEQIEDGKGQNKLTDFYIQDQDFTLSFLAGNQIHIQTLDEYPPKPESEINEEQYFEEDSTP